MMKWFKRVSWFYVFLTFFPLLYLWTANAAEIEPSDVLRPLLVTAAGSALLYLILALLFRHPTQTNWAGGWILILFFSYGHVYNVLRHSPALSALGHHRILTVIYLILFGLGIWGILKYAHRLEPLTRWVNIFSGILVLMSLLQLAFFYTNRAITTHQAKFTQPEASTKAPFESPDIYLIVLDTYMRADALEQEMGFDNSAFIDQLEEMGFYVASCSRANYGYTRASVASVLNMDYLPALETRTGLTTEDDGFWNIIKNSEVRRQLESNGYQTVAFQSEYPWLEISDADVFLRLQQSSLDTSYILPFERLYIRTSAVILWEALENKLGISFTSPDQNTGETVETDIDPYIRYHIDLKLFTLDKLSELPSLPGPKFVYAHIIAPHAPHVFTPDGKIVPGLTYEDYTHPTGSEADRLGYLNSVQFINSRIMPVLQNILENSPSAPIILLQGDHGYQDGGPGQYTILNAYFLPNGYANLYPSITPVNSFRIILNEYFGAAYPLLPDASYDNNGPIPETFPGCIP
jgi:hypothetical protein